MRKSISLLLFATAFSPVLGTVHAQFIEAPKEIRGSVEQWAPGARVIKVGGETYTLSKEVQLMDSNTALIKNNAVRPGGKVLLLISQGEVSHVVVNPGVGPVMDQPQR
jgi:hypothetical protein